MRPIPRLVQYGMYAATVVVLLGVLSLLSSRSVEEASPSPLAETMPATSSESTPAPVVPLPAEPESGLAEPVTEFKARITKKPFGIFITPETSPVQPERFRGYHTGADVEYADIPGDVAVKAIAPGRVVLSRTASGYGGVIVIEHEIDGGKKLALYGHLDPASMKPVGADVARGEQIAILGDNQSAETDGERKHLHFAILAKSSLDLKGYVQTEGELVGWHNPLSFYH